MLSRSFSVAASSIWESVPAMIVTMSPGSRRSMRKINRLIPINVGTRIRRRRAMYRSKVRHSSNLLLDDPIRIVQGKLSGARRRPARSRSPRDEHESTFDWLLRFGLHASRPETLVRVAEIYVHACDARPKGIELVRLDGVKVRHICGDQLQDLVIKRRPLGLI